MYKCAECGEEYPRFQLLTRQNHRLVEHLDSLQRHLLDNPKCMDTYTELATEKYEEILEYVFGDEYDF